jgi:hypothetical protein
MPTILGMPLPLSFPYTKDLLIPIIIICFEIFEKCRPHYITLHIVKDVVVMKLFSPIYLSRHPSMDGIIQGRKPWQK